MKKNKKKKADSASVSQSKSDITNPALSGASSKKQADSTDVSMALILLPLHKLFTIVHRQREMCMPYTLPVWFSGMDNKKADIR